MPKPPFLVVALLLSVSAARAAQPQPAREAGTVPPPRFDERVLRVFFPDVFKEVGPGQPGGAAPLAAGSVAAPSPAAGTAQAGGGAAGGVIWSELIAAEALEAEIKNNVNTLAEAVSAIGHFKSGRHNVARRNFSVLATMFGVVAQHDADVRWKDKAAAIRDAVAKAGFNCKVGTDGSFNEAKARLDDLQSLLRGASVDLPPAEPAAPWAALSDIPPLMLRLEEAFQTRITPWLANKNDFSANQEKLAHEAQVLGVIAEVLQDDSYEGFGDDDEFCGHAQQMRQGAQELLAAARASDYDRARAAAATVGKSCSNCHENFR